MYNDYKEYHLFIKDNAFEKGVETSWAHAVSKICSLEGFGALIMPDDLGEIFQARVSVTGTTHQDCFLMMCLRKQNGCSLYILRRQDWHSYYGIEKQGLAYSLDHGVTWIKCDKNPIIKMARITSKCSQSSEIKVICTRIHLMRTMVSGLWWWQEVRQNLYINQPCQLDI